MSKKKKENETQKLIFRSWIAFISLLFASLAAEMFIHPHAVFAPEKIPFFHAWFGFAACAVIVIFSKFVGFFLKRSENYYNKEQ